MDLVAAGHSFQHWRILYRPCHHQALFPVFLVCLHAHIWPLTHLPAVDIAEGPWLWGEADHAVQVLEDAVLAGYVGAHQLDVLRDVRLRGSDLGHPHLDKTYRLHIVGNREPIRARRFIWISYFFLCDGVKGIGARNQSRLYVVRMDIGL
jgi:hypothetical protein